jgi:hypothetical protein
MKTRAGWCECPNCGATGNDVDAWGHDVHTDDWCFLTCVCGCTWTLEVPSEATEQELLYKKFYVIEASMDE